MVLLDEFDIVKTCFMIPVYGTQESFITLLAADLAIPFWAKISAGFRIAAAAVSKPADFRKFLLLVNIL